MPATSRVAAVAVAPRTRCQRRAPRSTSSNVRTAAAVCGPSPMAVRSDRHYRFGLEPEVLWASLVRIDDYRVWWPWLRGFDATAFAEGERWTCVVQPPLPYALRFVIALEEVEAPRFVTATISGDITGHAA